MERTERAAQLARHFINFAEEYDFYDYRDFKGINTTGDDEKEITNMILSGNTEPLCEYLEMYDGIEAKFLRLDIDREFSEEKIYE